MPFSTFVHTGTDPICLPKESQQGICTEKTLPLVCSAAHVMSSYGGSLHARKLHAAYLI